MERSTIREYLAHRPFKPFTLIASSGDRYPVTHPDAALVARTQVVIALPDEKDNEATDRIARLSFLHVVGVEDGVSKAG